MQLIWECVCCSGSVFENIVFLIKIWLKCHLFGARLALTNFISVESFSRSLVCWWGSQKDSSHGNRCDPCLNRICATLFLFLLLFCVFSFSHINEMLSWAEIKWVALSLPEILLHIPGESWMRSPTRSGEFRAQSLHLFFALVVTCFCGFPRSGANISQNFSLSCVCTWALDFSIWQFLYMVRAMDIDLFIWIEFTQLIDISPIIFFSSTLVLVLSCFLFLVLILFINIGIGANKMNLNCKKQMAGRKWIQKWLKPISNDPTNEFATPHKWSVAVDHYKDDGGHNV